MNYRDTLNHVWALETHKEKQVLLYFDEETLNQLVEAGIIDDSKSTYTKRDLKEILIGQYMTLNVLDSLGKKRYLLSDLETCSNELLPDSVKESMKTTSEVITASYPSFYEKLEELFVFNLDSSASELEKRYTEGKVLSQYEIDIVRNAHLETETKSSRLDFKEKYDFVNLVYSTMRAQYKNDYIYITFGEELNSSNGERNRLGTMVKGLLTGKNLYEIYTPNIEISHLMALIEDYKPGDIGKRRAMRKLYFYFKAVKGLTHFDAKYRLSDFAQVLKIAVNRLANIDDRPLPEPNAKVTL